MTKSLLTGALAAFAAVAGCAPRVHLAPAALTADRTIVLNDHPLRLHFANPRARHDLPLLIFATGDGGWHRKDLDAWRHLASWGYPIVGFDARDYVTHLGSSSDTTTPQRLAADYARIIDVARTTLGLDAAHPVVLVGVSRGAGLSVVAAGQRPIRAVIGGVLAVALTREEEYVKWYRRLRPRPRTAEMVQVYEYLPRLGALPLAVVQSTRDNYLPAAQARALFGPDSPHRRFQAVEAHNHSFGGARDDLYRAMAGSLDWIDTQLTAR
jgi:pimeloyl-ACP methyl ester carboxylesterase